MNKVHYTFNQQSQTDAFYDAKNTALIVGGRGSGKTYVGSLRFLMDCIANYPLETAMVTTTDYDLGRYMIPAFVDRMNEFGLRYELKLSGDRKRGRSAPHIRIGEQVIHCISANSGQQTRLHGLTLACAWVDEAHKVRDLPDNVTKCPVQNLKMCLRHPDAQICRFIATTTPEGRSGWVFNDWVVDPGPKHVIYRLRTEANRAHLSDDYIDNLRHALTEAQVQAYLEGHFVDISGNRAHYLFNDQNIINSYEPNPKLPVIVGIDINVDNCSWILAQEVDDKFIQFDELVIEKDATIDKMVSAAHARGWGEYPIAKLCPDVSASARSASANFSAYQQIIKYTAKLGWTTKTMNKHKGRLQGAPAVNDRITRLNGIIYSQFSGRRLLITKNCAKTIEYMNNTILTPEGKYPKDKANDPHLLDALGYAVWWGLESHKSLAKIKNIQR